MAVDFAVATKFTAIDRVSRAFKDMGRASDKFGNKAEKSFLRASRAGNKFRGVTKDIIKAQLLTKGFQLMSQGVRSAATEFVNFDDSITAATARFKDVEAGSAQAAKTMELLRKAARKAGSETQFSAAKAAQGLDFFARAGFTSAEAMGVLKSQIDLATATGEDFARVADISSDLLGALGLNAQDSATKIGNLKKMNNLLAVATNSANVTMEDLFETIKVAGPIASRAGESQEKIIAMAAALGSAGIKGSMGATALKNAYIRLLDVSPKVSKALAGVGLSTKDFVDKSGKMKSMTKIMALLGKKTSKLGSAAQLKFFSVVFGKMAVAGASNLSKSLSQVEKTLKAMEDSRAMEKIAEAMRKSLGPRIQIIKSGLYEIAFKVFTAFEKRGKAAMDRLTTAIQKFNPTPIINGLEDIIRLMKTANSLGGTLGTTLNILSKPFTGKSFFSSMIDLIDGFISKINSLTQHMNTLVATAVFDFSVLKDIGMGRVGVMDLFSKQAANWSESTNIAERGMSQAFRELNRGIEERRDRRNNITRSEAPNEKEAEARATSNKTFIEGLFSFENAPKNMKFNATNAPGIDTRGLGTQ